jgi:aspartyl-tRNA(Asn)/glutamyl-tRNA(Gln) amidotransferase subunit A
MSSFPATIAEAAIALRAHALTSVELVEGVLARADALDGDLGSFLARFDEQALAAARTADDELAGGTDRGPLHGIPIGVKDLLSSREGPTTAHSRVQVPGAPPNVDAEAVARLRDAGAVIVGKTSLSEFALGAPDPEAGLPLPRNPWHREYWPGGSSSGTASGLAAGLFLGGVGTDTGGSIRIPAAVCGITGLKPTYGRVPKSRCIPLGWSLDTVGPMARSAEDCALLLQVLAGHLPSDPTSADEPVPDYGAALTGDLTGIRVGVERAHHGAEVGTDPAVLTRMEDALSVLEDAGARIEEVSVEHWDEFADAALVIMHSEAFTFHRPYLRDYWADYGSFTRVLLAHGAFLSASDYVQAQRVRSLARAEVARIHERVDVIVSPTVGVPAPRLDDDFLALMPLFFTGVWNVTGSPALSLPVEPEHGLPVGVQIIGRAFDEATTLRVGDAYQRRTPWHRRELVEVGSVPADGGD